MKRVSCFSLLIACLLFMAGCATIILGKEQQIGISSSPSGAKVSVNGRLIGDTPVIASLARGDKQIVKINLDGYQPYEIALSRNISGWVWGNIIFGGFIGLAVDALTGSMYMISPENISATLLKKEADMSSLYFKNNMVVVSVVLAPQQGWVKIGELTPVDKH